MNEKGNFILIILLLFLFVGLLPAIAMWFFPQMKVIIQIILIFIIYSIVRSYLGSSVLTIIISAILIYILVIKYPEVSAGVFLLYTVASLMVSSAIIWGASFFLQRR